MKMRFFLLLFFLPLLAKGVWITWSAPEQVQTGQSYTVNVYIDPEGYDAWGFDVSLYENGGLVAQDNGVTSISYSGYQSSAGTVTYSVDAWSPAYGWTSSSYSIQVISSNHAPQATCDGVTSTSVTQGGVLGTSGWALDYEQGAPVSRVEILIDGSYVGNATLNGSRPDVQSANASWGNWSPLDVTYSGWTYVINTNALSPGTHSVKGVAYDNQGASSETSSYSFTINEDRAPELCYDGLSVTTVVRGQTVGISGWALDREQGAPISRVEIVVDNTSVGNATLGGYRPDVQSANISWGNWSPLDVSYSGWNYAIATSGLSVGSHSAKAIGYDNTGHSTALAYLSFDVILNPVYTVSVSNGTASPAQGVSGSVVTLSAGSVYGYLFDHWELVSGSGNISSPSSSTSSFTIGTSNASVRAVFKGTEAPTTTLSASQTSVALGAPVTITSITTDPRGYLINQAIDYIIPGGTSWVAGTGSAGSRWDGSSTSSNTLNFTFTPDRVGTWQFRARGCNYSGTQSGFKYLNVLVSIAVPSITSVTTATATTTTVFSYQITATGSPSSYSASGLPSGLSVSTSTGLISGLPTASGVFYITLGATNTAGTGTATLTLTVSVGSTSTDSDGDGYTDVEETLLGTNPQSSTGQASNNASLKIFTPNTASNGANP